MVSGLELAALPTAVPCGRLHAKNLMLEWRFEQLADDVSILVSELLTNAVKASWSPGGVGVIALQLLAAPRQVLIEVWDNSPRDPRQFRADRDSEFGRGLTIVEALSHRWGYRRVNANLKVVWCEVVVKTQ
jgi:anti-sigma regulatory factor (Ser/Thr protein kinase)